MWVNTFNQIADKISTYQANHIDCEWIKSKESFTGVSNENTVLRETHKLFSFMHIVL